MYVMLMLCILQQYSASIKSMCLYLLQCVDINSVSLYDSDVRRENLKTFRVLQWSKLLTQDLQNLTEIKEEKKRKVVERRGN